MLIAPLDLVVPGLDQNDLVRGDHQIALLVQHAQVRVHHLDPTRKQYFFILTELPVKLLVELHVEVVVDWNLVELLINEEGLIELVRIL